MPEAVNKTVIRAVRVLECLFEDDFQGKTELQILECTKVPLPTIYRVLQTWKSLGWVIDVPIPGRKAAQWRINSEKLLRIAHSHKRHMLRQVHSLEKEYLDIAGEELRA
ncbi:hypothetical protein [Methylocaldum szegediense]|uniref:hypothetical protein n=1 Tax=Methylocaldum szegediense TaxID=73780 RepID=UPI0004122852|nr:hypothetical protein [Methylocaldum szegediense]